MDIDGDELMDILETNNVNVSKEGNICLWDIVTNVIESRRPKIYVKKLMNKYHTIEINENPYITLDNCIDILRESKFVKCKEICKKIMCEGCDNISIIDVENEIFKFEGCKFMAYFAKTNNDYEIWVHGSSIAKYLGYNDTNQAIRVNIHEKNKILYKELMNRYDASLGKISNMTIFINMNGLIEIVLSSKKPKAIRMAKFLNVNITYKKSYHEQSIMTHLIEYFETINVIYLLQYGVPRKNGSYYYVDCYLPDYVIAIEIDENGHDDRDPEYEVKREAYITRKLKCKFLRVNPDDKEFSIFRMIGKISNMIYG